MTVILSPKISRMRAAMPASLVIIARVPSYPRSNRSTTNRISSTRVSVDVPASCMACLIKTRRPLISFYSPTNDPSGATMKSAQTGLNDRHFMSSIAPITRMFPRGRASQRTSISKWY